MGTGAFIAAEGAKVQARYLDVVSNNLANAGTVGYKAEDLNFGEYLVKTTQKEYGFVLEKENSPKHVNETQDNQSMVKITGSRTDFSQGFLEATGNTFDVAIQGEGFFQVSLNDEAFFTRDGRCFPNADGELIHTSGGKLLDDSGSPIVIVPDEEGKVNIDENGMISQGKTELAKIGVYALEEKEKIKKIGHNLFNYTSVNSPPEEAEKVLVKQGYLEKSNVNPIAEMTKMIKINRHFEYMTKALQAYRDADQKSTQGVGESR